MPRQSTKSSTGKTAIEQVEEDFLQVDKSIPGQNFVCLSFVSPENIIADKKLFFFHNYVSYRMQLYQREFETGFEKIMESAEDGKVDVAKIVDLRKSIAKFYKDDKLDFKGFKEVFDDFVYRDEEKLSEVFDKANKHQTSVRGLKVRGVYDTKKEADVRAKALQSQDTSFDVFVGQVGYWLPWDPTSTKIEDQEYQNSELNKLVKEYKANSTKKDQLYQEQKEERMKGAISTEERAKHAAGLKSTMDEAKSIAGSSSAAASSSIDNGAGFGGVDPWMARKMEEASASSSSSDAVAPTTADSDAAASSSS
jgi:hypothetical protein